MKKKFLALLLVLCMILPMVPVGVISVFAADEEALPSSSLHREDISATGGVLTLPDGWDLVQYNAGTYDASTAVYPTSYALVGGWFGNCVVDGKNSLPLIHWNDGNDDGAAGPYMGLLVPNAYGGSIHAAYSYEAPYTGVVDITVDWLRHLVALGSDRYVAIFVDGEMVWPSTTGSYSDKNTWYKIAGSSVVNEKPASNAAFDVSVEAGQKIEFFISAGGDYAHEGIVQADLTVAYTEYLPNSTLTPDAVTLPASGGKVTLPDGWSFVAHGAQEHPNTTAPHNGYETTYVLDTYVTGGIYCALTGAENGTGTDFAASWDPSVNGIDATRLPVITFNSTQAGHIDMGINACVVYSGGYAYEAPVTGYITIDLENVTTGGGTQAGGWGGFGDTYVALFVGGEMVWPTGGSYDDRDSWYNLNGNGGQNKTDLVNNGATVSNVYVEAGQAVEFLVLHSWWDNPVRADMTVAYTETLGSSACVVKVVNASGVASTTVQAGDQFTLPAYDGVGLCRGWDANGDGVVDYAADSTIIVNSSMTLMPVLVKAVFDRTKVSVGSDCKVVLPAGFGLVTRSVNDYATKYDITTLYNGGGNQPTTGVTGESWFRADELWWGDAHIAWNNRGDNNWCWGASMGLGASDRWNIGYVYTAEYTGYVDISIDQILDMRMNNTEGWANPNKYIAVFVNGAMVWPTSGGSYTNAADWLLTSDDMSAASLDQSLLQNVFVKEGDKVELLAKSTVNSDAVYVGWSVNYTSAVDENSYLVEVLDDTGYRLDVHIVQAGDTVTLPSYDNGKVAFIGWDVNGDGYADYTANSTITVSGDVKATAVMAKFSFNRNDVSYDDNYKVVLPAGWELVARKADAYNNKMSIVNLGQGNGQPGPGGEGWFFPEGTISWYGDYPAIGWLNKYERSDCWGPWLGLGATPAWNTGYSYTATFNGTVDVTFDAIRYFDVFGGDWAVDTKWIALFVDGVMVWPTAGGSYTNTDDWYKAKANDDLSAIDPNGLLKNISVDRGDKIELIAKGAKNTATVQVDFTINYKEFEPTYVKVNTPEAVILPAVPGQPVKLPNYTGDDLFLGWDANGDGTIDYADKATITMPDVEVLELNPVLAASGSVSENLPAVDANNNVTYKNSWKVGMHDVVGGKFLPYTNYANSYLCYGNNLALGGLCIDKNAEDYGKLVMPAMSGYYATMQYTTEMAGYITIDFNTLSIMRTLVDDEQGAVAGGIEIYINNVLVAGAYYESGAYAAAGTYTDEGALLADIRAQLGDAIAVQAGDVIEFRMVQGNAKTNVAVVDPVITWEDVSFAPEITATSVTIGKVKNTENKLVEGFALNVYATLNAPRMDYCKNADKVVLYFLNIETGEPYYVTASWVEDNTTSDSAFADVTYVFQLPAMDVTELSTDFIVVVAMAYDDGTVVFSNGMDAVNSDSAMSGEVVNAVLASDLNTWDWVSAEAYAYNAAYSNSATYETKQAAAALLNYAAAADVYFNGYTDVEIPELNVKLPTIKPVDVYNKTEFEGKADITGATLNIEETISMIIYLDSDEDMTGWRLQMDDEDSFSSPKSLTISERRAGGYMVEVTIPTSSFGDAFYFRVVDNRGEQQSGVLTYSVESYVARMYQNENADEALLNLLDAMLVICKIGNSMR